MPHASARPRLLRLVLAVATAAGLARGAASPAVAANPTIASATLSPSGQLLYVVPKKGDGSSALFGISAVAGSGATITVDGATRPLTDPLSSVGWEGFVYPLLAPPKTVGVDDSDAAWAGTGTWTDHVPSAGVGGYFDWHEAVNSRFRTGADGACTWTFSGLTPGRHEVNVHIWGLVGPDRTSDAVYTVKDGAGKVLATQHRDLQTKLHPRSDRLVNGQYMHTIGVVALDAGQDTIVLHLDNAAKDGVLVADYAAAVRIMDPFAAPGSKVTVDFPKGTATVGGDPTDAATLPVTFSTDETFFFPIPDPADRHMGVGYNLECVREDWFTLAFADRSFGCDVWAGNVTVDEHYEMLTNTGMAQRTVLFLDNLDGTTQWGMYLLDEGTIRFEFTVSGSPFGADQRAAVGLWNYGGYYDFGPTTWTDLGNNRWRMEVPIARQRWTPIATRTGEFNPRWTPGLLWRAYTPGVIYRDWRWYDSRTPATWTKRAHPIEVGRLQKDGKAWVRAIRGIGPLGTTASTCAEPGDFPDVLDRETFNADNPSPRVVRYVIRSTDILAIHPVDTDPATDADKLFRYFPGTSVLNGWVKVQLKDGAAFSEGIPIEFAGPVQTYASTVPGTNLQLANNQLTYHIDDNNLLMACSVDVPYDVTTPRRATLPATVDLAGKGYKAEVQKRAPFPLEWFVEYCSDVGCSPWINVPHAATDRLVDWMARKVIAGTPDGRKVYVEYSNETWNPFFNQWSYFTSQYAHANWLHARDPVANPYHYDQTGPYGWVAHRAGQVHKVFRDAFAAAGRDPNLVVRLMGAQTQNMGPTVATCEQCTTEGIGFDYLVLESYQDLVPPGTGDKPWQSTSDLGAVFGRFDRDGFIDLAAISSFHGSRQAFTAGHRSILDKHGFGSVPLATYEGGWSELAPSYGKTRQQQVEMLNDIVASPRMHRLTGSFLSYLESLGYAFDMRYTWAYYSIPSATISWSDLYWTYQQAGTGAPTENANRGYYPDYKGQSYGGRMDYATGAAFPAATPAPTPTPTPAPTPASVLASLKAALSAQIDAMGAATASGDRKVVSAASAAARAILDLADQVTGYLAPPKSAPAAPSAP